MSVRATDEAGNTETTETFSWTTDLMKPTSSIGTVTDGFGETIAPSGKSNSTSMTFPISGTDNVSDPSALTFECKLDAGSFAACDSNSSHTEMGLTESPDPHTLTVRATDEIGNVEVGVSFSWTTDLTKPTSSIDTITDGFGETIAPSGISNSTSMTFEFTGTDNESAPSALTFECKLDAGSFAACDSNSSHTEAWL